MRTYIIRLRGEFTPMYMCTRMSGHTQLRKGAAAGDNPSRQARMGCPQRQTMACKSMRLQGRFAAQILAAPHQLADLSKPHLCLLCRHNDGTLFVVLKEAAPETVGHGLERPRILLSPAFVLIGDILPHRVRQLHVPTVRDSIAVKLGTFPDLQLKIYLTQLPRSSPKVLLSHRRHHLRNQVFPSTPSPALRSICICVHE